jgi:hypothetical protein
MLCLIPAIRIKLLVVIATSPHITPESEFGLRPSGALDFNDVLRYIQKEWMNHQKIVKALFDGPLKQSNNLDHRIFPTKHSLRPPPNLPNPPSLLLQTTTRNGLKTDM